MQADAVNKPSCVLAVAVLEDFEANEVVPNDLILDIGAYYHVVGNIGLLIESKQAHKTLCTAADANLDVIGMDTPHVNLGQYQDRYGALQHIDLDFSNVVYAQECPYNPLSIDLL